MTRKYYATTKPTTLASSLSGVDTAVTLTDGSTFPDPEVPGNAEYTAILGYGSSREEVVTVTAKDGTNGLIVTRGEDSTAATAKNSGDVAVHGVSARDFTAVATIGTQVSAAVATAITVSTSAAAGTPTADQVLWIQV